MAAGVKSFSKTFVWIIVGLLILGLAGFGATNLSGTIRTVGSAGDQVISVDTYARELQREIRGFEAQTGQPLPMSQVQALGIDQTVLSRLVTLASLDHEVDQMGLSIGDENLQQEIIEIPAFQGIDGQFDRDSYSFALSQTGMNEVEFEKQLRAETARTLVQGGIVAGVKMPAILAETLSNYISARRSFTWAALSADILETPIADPTSDQLKAFFEANSGMFELPETKRLTYVLLTPDMILDQVEVDEAALRELYESRSAEYDLPERRLVEQLAFSDVAAASSAMAQLEVGGSTFDALVEERGLRLSDIDLGDVTKADLRGAADEVFAAEMGDVVGPLESSLGPALFRINGKLAARLTTFEDVQAELRAELAGDRARRLIDAGSNDIDDLLAGGATLEELATETDMEIGQLSWTADAFEGIAAYEEFRAIAATVTEEDFPAVAYIEDGGIFALRVDEVLPVRPEPFEQARDKVTEAWKSEQTETALKAHAEAVISGLKSGDTPDFADTGLKFRVENGLTRTAFVEGTPPDFMNQVFEMEKEELRIIAGGGAVLIVRLDDTLAPDDTPEVAEIENAISGQLNQTLAQALFQAFARDAQIRAKPQIDQRALNAVQASFQ